MATVPVQADRPELVLKQGGDPKPSLSVFDASAIIVGIVVGAGIFRMPGLVASSAGSELNMMLLWVAGGVISLIGALCYAELATAYPHAGGDYHFLTRAFGRSVSFLFGWARMTIIQPGSIALQAYIIGDYMTQVTPLGPASSSIYAGTTVVLLTAINIAGIIQGKWTQNLLTVSTVAAVAAVALAGLFFGGTAAPAAAPATSAPAIGMAMVFVLLTYGGWNEAAYLSAEVKNGRGGIAKALFWGIGAITALYLLVNFVLVRGLGFTGLAGSEVPAADLLKGTPLGDQGAAIVSLIIVIAALSTTNATIITGARTNFALGRDYRILSFLGRWQDKGNTPVHALLVQGVISLGLVGVALGVQQSGVETMVAYSAPVFWLFLMLVGFSVFILRRWEPEKPRTFKVPLYPLTPLLFCAVTVYMLHSSLSYAASLDFGIAGWIGIGVLGLGAFTLLLARPNGHSQQHDSLRESTR